MKRLRRIGWGAWTAALALAGGCTTLLGVDANYHGVVDDGAGGEPATNSSASVASATGEASASGSGGAPDSSSASTSSASASSGSGGGGCTIVHAGGKGTCEYLPGKECGCAGPGEKCSISGANQQSGASACVLVSAIPKSTWEMCDTDSDCGPGVWCDHVLHVCKPICATTDQCPLNAHCTPVVADGVATPIPGLKVCTAHCDPMSANPCGAGATCYFDGAIGEFDCVAGGNGAAGSACSAAGQCAKGLVCLVSGGVATCERWCEPADGLFSSACALANNNKPYCDMFAMMPKYNGVLYGACSP